MPLVAGRGSDEKRNSVDKESSSKKLTSIDLLVFLSVTFQNAVIIRNSYVKINISVVYS